MDQSGEQESGDVTEQEQLRVRGIDGLRVVDAAVFPDIPGFFIASAGFLVSERAADLLLAEHPVD